MTATRGEVSAAEYRAAAELRAGLRKFSQATERILRRHGLTPERYELLLAVKVAQDDEESITVSELAAALGLAQSSVTQLVRRVEDAGLLRREVSTRDARVRHLGLTKRGERQLARALGGLREEREHLTAVLEELIARHL